MAGSSRTGSLVDGGVVFQSAFSKHRNNLNLAHFNCCSINPASQQVKLDELRSMMRHKNLSVVGLSETWLKGRTGSKGSSDRSVAINGYKIIRNDRMTSTAGGGVAMYVRKSMKTRVVAKSAGSSIEYLFVEITSLSVRSLVGVVYRPPNADNLPTLDSLFSVLFSSYNSVIVMGDFNHNLLDVNISNMLESFLSGFNLSVIHNHKATHFTPNRRDSLLDYFVTNSRSRLQSTGQFWVPSISHHACIYASFDFSTEIRNESFQYYDYKSIDIASLDDKLLTMDFSRMYTSTDVDIQIDTLNSNILSLFHEFTPLRTVKRRKVNGEPPWYTPFVKQACQLRDLAFGAFRMSRRDVDWKVFCRQRNIANQAIHKSKKNFGCNLFRYGQSNSAMWKKVRELGVLKEKLFDCVEISADSFCQHFAEVQSERSGQRTDVGLVEPSNAFAFRGVDEEDILKAVYLIRSNAMGIDQISLKFIKIILPSISAHVKHLVNTVFSTSTFPEAWKVAVVKPISKVLDPTDIKDFRPISLLPVLSKVFEMIARDQMVNFMSANQSLTIFQSAYKFNHSAPSAVLHVTEDMERSIERKEVTTLVLLDFSKAFDSISHVILCHKLKSQFAFSSFACDLIFSYLTNRSQCVDVGKERSCLRPLFSGVPQGSVLGPLLFSAYINDVTSVLKFCTPHLYADDLQIYLSGPLDQLTRRTAEINSDLSSISGWAIENKLKLNPCKSQALTISSEAIDIVKPHIELNGEVVPFFRKVRNLGIIMNERLDWDSHIESICGKVYGALRTLRTAKHYLPLFLRRKLVISLVIPHFLYGDIIFSNCSGAARYKLHLCFNACLRFIHSIRKFDHISHVADSIFGCSLWDYYNYRTLIFLRKVMVSHQPEYIFNDLVFASSNRTKNLIIPTHTTARMNGTFRVRSARLWNGLPHHVKSLDTLPTFKQACRNHLNIKVDLDGYDLHN